MQEGKPLLINAQVSLYFQEAIKADKLWYEIVKIDSLNQKFTETPIMVPVPLDKEFDEAAAVIANSKNGYNLTIARNRLNLVKGLKDDVELESITAELFSIIDTILKIFEKDNWSNSKINRIGFIARYFIKDKNPAEKIAAMLRPGLEPILGSGSASESDIRLGVSEKIAAIDCVSFVYFKTAQIKQGSEIESGIALERDFNTAPKIDGPIYGRQQIQSFLNESLKRFGIQDLMKFYGKEEQE